MSHLLKLLTGPEDIGRSRWFWAAFVAVCVFLFVYPFWLSEFEATNNAYYLLNVPIALGLALLWGSSLAAGEVSGPNRRQSASGGEAEMDQPEEFAPSK